MSKLPTFDQKKKKEISSKDCLRNLFLLNRLVLNFMPWAIFIHFRSFDYTQTKGEPPLGCHALICLE